MTKEETKEEKKSVEPKKEIEKNIISKDEIEALTNLAKRIQADFENYRKRMEAEQERFKQTANKELLKDLLPIMDNLELSFNHLHNPQEFQKGIELVKNQFHSLLESHGVKEIIAKNNLFDPKYHEALLAEESDKDGAVLEVLQKGYLHNDALLRTAKVKVSKKRPENAEQKNSN